MIHRRTDLSSAPKISALSPVVVDFGGSQSGNRCMAILTVDACWTVRNWEQALCHIQQRYMERLISRRWETMPEINSYFACAQLINHHNTFGIWEKKGESAATYSVSVDPQIPIAGVAQWPTSLDCIQGFVGLYHMTYMHVSSYGNEPFAHLQLLQTGMATEIPVLNLGYQCGHILHNRFIQWTLPLSPIFPAGTYCKRWICTKPVSEDDTFNQHSNYRPKDFQAYCLPG